MAWDFETDPEYQRLLDWADRFVTDEVEPLDFVLSDPYDKSDERATAIVRPRQQLHAPEETSVKVPFENPEGLSQS